MATSESETTKGRGGSRIKRSTAAKKRTSKYVPWIPGMDTPF